MWGLHAGSVTGVTDETVLAWLEEAGATYPVMRDLAGTYGDYDHLGATAPFPLDVLVDQEGIVRYVDTRYDPDALEAVIENLLGR